MHERPDPDLLLARMQTASTAPTRGHLKLFFGASAGVGKTYAMLEAAHERRAAGVDVVVGIVEAHGRRETEALLTGLERLPLRQQNYRGTTLEEFDIDAALARHPALIIVDELAHSNTPGSRHTKRWQDVSELLDAGIDVYTAMNVQHVESLNDSVAQVTGVLIRETVPDQLLERADEVELIDLSPDELLQRLRDGKVYIPQQAEQATRNFFRKGNLIALREMALRRTADRVDAQMEQYRRSHAISNPWPASSRILVGISSGPSAPRLVRAGRQLATALRAEWVAVYVETPNELRRPESERELVVQALQLAEQLGAETVTLSDSDISQALLTYARERNATRILVGQPLKRNWRDWLLGSPVDQLIRNVDAIDISIITSAPDDPRPPLAREPERRLRQYAQASFVVALCTAIAWVALPFLDAANIVMIYLLGIIGIARKYGRGAGIVASFLSVCVFDFFFVSPPYTLAISDTQYLITFVTMLTVSLVISTLTARLQQQAITAHQRERRTAALYAFSRQLADAKDLDHLLPTIVRHVYDTFASQAMLLLPSRAGQLQPWGATSGWSTLIVPEAVFAPNGDGYGVAEWVFKHQQMAGTGTGTLPGADALYLPLQGVHGPLGVLGVRIPPGQRQFSTEQRHLLEAFATQGALAIERAQLSAETQQAHLQIQTEQLRNALLSSVSHDLRTPLATITGAASSLLEGGDTLDLQTRRELAQATYDEAERLNRLLRNLLDMTRLESGNVTLHREPQAIEEIIGAALERLNVPLADRVLQVTLADDLPLVSIDAVLVEQIFINLFENTLKYTPAGSPIELSVVLNEGRAWLLVTISDHGPGIPPGSEQRIFEKFYRAPQANPSHGVGLGLTICQGIVEAHGGQIWASNNPDGGASFFFTLPAMPTPLSNHPAEWGRHEQ